MHRAPVITMLGALVATSLPNALEAQRTQEQLKAQAAEKLKKPFLQNAQWELDYDKARAEAKKQGKWLLTYFTRTYAP